MEQLQKVDRRDHSIGATTMPYRPDWLIQPLELAEINNIKPLLTKTTTFKMKSTADVVKAWGEDGAACYMGVHKYSMVDRVVRRLLAPPACTPALPGAPMDYSLKSSEVVEKMCMLLDPGQQGEVHSIKLFCGLVVLCRGSPKDKLSAVFQMMDTRHTGTLARDELFRLLSVLSEEPVDNLRVNIATDKIMNGRGSLKLTEFVDETGHISVLHEITGFAARLDQEIALALGFNGLKDLGAAHKNAGYLK